MLLAIINVCTLLCKAIGHHSYTMADASRKVNKLSTYNSSSIMCVQTEHKY